MHQPATRFPKRPYFLKIDSDGATRSEPLKDVDRDSALLTSRKLSGFRFSVFAISIPRLRTHAGAVASSRLMRRDLHSICFSSALHTAARPGPRPRQRVWSAVNMGNRATFKAGCFGGCVLSVVFTTESTHHNPVSCARGKKINRHITLIYLLARDFNFKCLGLLTSGIENEN